jgi:hypothetical protein
MSKGYGRVQAAICKAFTENPHRVFSVEELVRLVFPDAKKIERRHYVSVLQAARDFVYWANWRARFGTFEPPSIQLSWEKAEAEAEKRIAEHEVLRATFRALKAYERRVRQGLETEAGLVPTPQRKLGGPTPQRKLGGRKRSTLPPLPSDLA